MSQRRQTSEEALAAREALDNLPENVTPLPFTDIPEPEWDENDPPAPEAPLTDEDVENFLAEEPEAEQGYDPGTPEGDTNVDTTLVECPCCGAMVMADCVEEAIEICKCSGAKILRQENEMNEQIDKSFGPSSKERFGFAHDVDETNILKLIAAYVAKRRVKAVTITLNGNDKCVILIKKDATVVRRTRSIKEENEV